MRLKFICEKTGRVLLSYAHSVVLIPSLKDDIVINNKVYKPMTKRLFNYDKDEIIIKVFQFGA
jgi:hypothetical protein